MFIDTATTEKPTYLKSHRRFAIREQLAPATISNYAFDWRTFTRWCEVEGRASLPASTPTIDAFAAYQLARDCTVSTAMRRFASIRHYHRKHQCPDPVTSESFRLLMEVKRARLETPRQKRPVQLEELRRICGALPATRRGDRDRAVLLLGFCSALRRSNLAALNLEDLSFTPAGVLVRIHREKQDQEARGRVVGIPRGATLCAVSALETWIARRGTSPGALFLNIRRPCARIEPARVAAIVKRYVVDPGHYGAHSLRAGFVTEALDQGLSEVLIAKQTGHRSLNTLRLYYRSRDPLRGNACAMLGM